MADSLRGKPVTLLHGATAADREGLLTFGVLPMLGRRCEDRMALVRRARRLPFPERRSALGRGAAVAEWVLVIDDWAGTPLPTLASHIQRARSSSGAHDPNGQTPGRVLLVMHGFEEALARAAGAIHPDPFWPELARALQTRPHGPHLLLLTQEAETPAMRWLGQHVPRLGEQALLLKPWPPGVSPQLAPVRGLVGAAAPELASASPVIPAQDWTQALQGAFERAATRAAAARAAAPIGAAASEVSTDRSAMPLPTLRFDGGVVPAVGLAPGAGTAQALAARVAAIDPRPVAAKGARRSVIPRMLLPAFGTAVCAGLAAALWLGGSLERERVAVDVSAPADVRPPGPVAVQSGPSAALPLGEQRRAAVALEAPSTVTRPAAESLPPVSPAAVPLAAIAAVDGTPRPMPFDTDPGSALRGVLAGLPLLDLRGEPEQTAARLTAVPQPMLALVRYDTLQKLPASASLSALRVVAPLFVEPMQVWVRADSPQRRLDELGTGVIDVGRNGGDVASAAGMTAALFGKPTPGVRQRRLSDDQALAALQRGDVDAVLRVQASPLTARASAAVAAGTLRTLVVDRASPAGARALREYLPAPTAAGDRTLGVMSLLIVHGGPAASRLRLASDALRALCTGLHTPSMEAALVWAAVRPDVQLPVGRPYVMPAEQAAGCGRGSAKPADAKPDASTLMKGT